MKNLISYTLVFTLLLSSCTKKEEPVVSNKKVEDLEAAIFDFGFDQLKELSKTEEDNVLISPLSIASALYMTSFGAENATKEQMLATLHINGVDPNHGMLYKELFNKLHEANGETKVEISNKVFFDDNRLDINDSFKDECIDNFEASPVSLDFRNETSVDGINNWVSDATNERIPKVIDQINDDEIMFLINALYFIGDWESGFPDNSTHDRPFNKNNGSTINVPTMFNDGEYAHIDKPTYSAVTLLFKEGNYEMTFILPTLLSSADFVQSHDHGSFRELLGEIEKESISERILLQMPKLEVKTKYNLVESLKGLGMTDAFSEGGADFTKFGSAAGNIFLTRVLHDLYIKIDEKGVEGAAATTVGVGTNSLPPSVILDQPYLFVLSHKESSVPIFMGEVRDPSSN